MQEERDEERGNMPVPEDAGEEGLGTQTGGVGGPDAAEDQESGVGGEGSDAIDGPTRDADSVPGGGGATGPTPGGVPQEGDTESDPDTATESTE
jgi:hypothetical protein